MNSIMPDKKMGLDLIISRNGFRGKALYSNLFCKTIRPPINIIVTSLNSKMEVLKEGKQKSSSHLVSVGRIEKKKNVMTITVQ